MISTIINNVNCGANDLLGTGLNHCPIDITRITTLEFSARSFKYDDAEGDQVAYIRKEQQKGNIIILNGVVETAVETADDNITTRTGSGIEKLSGKNPIKWTFTFDNGIYFSKALQEMISYGQYNLAVYDSQGNKFFVETSNSEYKGFACYQVNAGSYMPSNGADAAQQTISLQLNREEYDKRISWIVADNLDYMADTDLDGYNDLRIDIVEANDTSDTFIIDVFMIANNKRVKLSGLGLDDLLLKINDVVTTPTTLTPFPDFAGRYTVTLAAALSSPDAMTLTTYDTVNETKIINIENVLYKSNTATYEVTA